MASKKKLERAHARFVRENRETYNRCQFGLTYMAGLIRDGIGPECGIFVKRSGKYGRTF